MDRSTLPTALFLLCYYPCARAEDYFDPAALELSDPQQKTTDPHYFAKPGGQQPGSYPVSVWVNDQQVAQETIEFVDDRGELLPRLTVAKLAEFGVNVSALAGFKQLHDDDTLTHIERFISDVCSQFDFTAQRLNLSIPQAAMEQQSRGYVDPSCWYDGIPAAFVDYNLTGSQARQGESDVRTSYLNLRSGVNLGSWRLRNIASMQYDKTRRWRSQSTYLQRDIRALKSQLRIGDSYTNGDVFDSVQFRGVQLMSQEEMLPDSQRGFAPVIRGMAHSNARVTVSQHGYVIYETFVAPGAFAINDLYPTAQSGDLEVTIKESDGSERKFTQPFSAVPFGASGSCQVTTPTINVGLGSVSKTEFKGVNTTGGTAQSFAIPVYCSQPTDVRIGFFGQEADPAFPDTLAITPMSGAAGGVGVKLSYGNPNPLP